MNTEWMRQEDLNKTMKTEVEIFLAKPVGLDLEERKDKTYLCCVFLYYDCLELMY